jgi:DNA polymerase
VIVPLGRHAARHWIPGVQISADHGVVVWVDGRAIVPMLHPAAGLYQPRNMVLLQTDFERLGEFLRARTAMPSGPPKEKR